MTQLVRVNIAFVDDPNSVPSLYVGELRTACNSQGIDDILWSLCVLQLHAHQGVCIHMQI